MTRTTTWSEPTVPPTAVLAFAQADVDKNGQVSVKDLEAVVSELVRCTVEMSELPDVDNNGIITTDDIFAVAEDIAKANAERSAGRGVVSDDSSSTKLEKSVSGLAGSGSGGNGESDTGSGVNITIFRGQNGLEVGDGVEESLGSFTVSNINDTDGDGVVDVSDGWVSATTSGYDEKDLMKLVVDKPINFTGGTTTVSVASGAGKICTNSKRGACSSSVSIADWQWSYSGMMTFWVESWSPSTAARDITVVASYGGDTDVVKATGIWSVLHAVEHSSKNPTAVFAALPNLDPVVKSAITTVGGTGTFPPMVYNSNDTKDWFRNGIAIEFEVFPHGVQNEPGIEFDMARRATSFVWRKKLGSPTELVTSSSMPSKLDDVNDDPDKTDEADSPNAQHLIAQMDSPGYGVFHFHVLAGYDLYQLLQNFEELVRVDVNGGDPQGTASGGSRAADKYLWHSKITIEWSGSVWQRLGGGPQTVETFSNRIDPGHIFLNPGI